jgi:hypothetical protein
MKKLLLLLFLPMFSFAHQNNEQPVQERQFPFNTNKSFMLLAHGEEIKEYIAAKKKIPKRKVFYRRRIRKGFAKQEFGQKPTADLFDILTKHGVFWNLIKIGNHLK